MACVQRGCISTFTEDVKKKAKEDQQDAENKRVVCTTNIYIEKEEEDDLGFKEARIFIDNQKKLIEEAK